jgi:hypothetical protein
MKLSKTTLVLLAVLGLAVVTLTARALADPGNEDWQTATEIFDGENSQHTVQAGGGGNPADEDWYKITLTENQVLQAGAVFNGQNGWLGVRVYGPDSPTAEVYRAEQNQVNAQEVDMFVFANGTYYIRFYVLPTGTSVPYAMLVRVTTPPTLTSGVSVSNTNPLMGNIISSTYYKIWMKGGNDTAEMAEAAITWTTVKPTNTCIYILARKDKQDLNLLNYSWSRSYEQAGDCRWGASYTGWYYVKVFTTTLARNADYYVTFSVHATILGNKHKTDGNVVQSDAKLVPIRQTVYGKISEAYDTSEWFKFYLNKGEQFSCKATLSDSHLAEYWDFYNLTMYTWNGTILTGGDNQGSTGAPISALSLYLGRAPYTGLYYISLSAIFSYSGSGTTDYTSGKLVNTCRYEMDILIPNRKVWIVDPPGEIRMDEDSEKTIDLKLVFWDPEGDTLTYGTTGGTANFTISISQSEGTLTIRPNPNWNGVDQFTLWAHDGRPDQKNSTLVTVVVKSVPDAPYVKKTAPNTLSILEDEVNTTALNLNDVFADVDLEDKFLVFSADQNEHVNIEIDQTSGRVTLWGQPNYNGEQDLTFYAADTYNFRVSHTIKIIVIPVNDPPVAVGKIPRLTMDEGTKSHIDVAQYFEDIDGDPLYYYAEWDRKDAINFDNLDSNPLNSWFDIYPENQDFYGFVQVVFIAYDRDPMDPKEVAFEARQSAILEVKNVNDPPRVDAFTPDYDPTIHELEEQTFSITSVYDVDSTSFRYKWFVNDVEQVEWSGSSFTFTTTYDSAGTYRVRCEVKDNLGEPATTMPEWTLTVLNTNRVPQVNLRTKDSTVPEGGKITLQADGYDQDGDSLTYTWWQIDPSGKEIEIGQGANFVLKKPLPAGEYRFKCYVDDGTVKQPSSQVQITVAAKQFPAVLPGFDSVAALAALGAAVAASAALVRSRRRCGATRPLAPVDGQQPIRSQCDAGIMHAHCPSLARARPAPRPRHARAATVRDRPPNRQRFEICRIRHIYSGTSEGGAGPRSGDRMGFRPCKGDRTASVP